MNTAIDNTRAYYQRTFQTGGLGPAGVDWGHERAQTTRFAQLLKLIPAHDWARRPSLNDLGCGYGALLGYLQDQGCPVDYRGVDLVPDMVQAAQQRWGAAGAFVVGSGCDRVADYAVASGLLNVRNDTPQADWQAFVESVLDDLHANSLLGFAFNCLTAYADPDRMQARLFYGDPLWFFDLCKRKYARNVALLHDYGLYDFTIIVRKEAAFAAG